MKANEAPEKLYLHSTAKGEVGASWLTFPLTNEDIEYTRTDAFIEKACEYLEPNVKIILCGDKIDTYKFIEDFRKYMGGE